MEPTILGGVVVGLGLVCVWTRFGLAVTIMFVLSVLGASSAVDLPALGGAAVTPGSLFLIFYVARFAMQRGALVSMQAELHPRRPLFLFLLLTMWVVVSALLLPRLFDGSIDVFSLSRSADNDGELTTLHPTGGNLSQAVYALGGMMAALVTGAAFRGSISSDLVIKAIVALTIVHLAFAFVDIVTWATGTGFILDFIHNGGYSYLTDDEVGGLKRISGSFSEASSFAAFSLTLLGLNFTLFLRGVQPTTTAMCSLVLALLIVLSTSSGGYVGLVILTTLYLCYATFSAVSGGTVRPLAMALLIACGVVAAFSAMVIFVPQVVDLARTVIDETLMSKTTSDSAIERGSWNLQAWQVFLDSYGLGAGVGSTRGSNYSLVLLSNLGLLGFGLFVALIARATLGAPRCDLDESERSVVYAARVALISTLAGGLFTGTVYDLGTLFYCMLGIAAAGAGRTIWSKRAEAPVRFAYEAKAAT